MTLPTPSGYSDDMLLAFLQRKLAGELLPTDAAPYFHAADSYAADPDILTSLHEPAPTKKGDGDSWFFFTHVKPKGSRDTPKSRQVAGGVGTWHSERAPRAVLDDEGKCIGHFQYFSYKIKTGKNCSERTKWYMVEFTDGDQEARKRKPTGELLSQASSPVKAKRRLFDSPAPVSSAAVSQEPASSNTWYELAAPFKSLHSGIKFKPSQDEAELETSPEQVRSYELFHQFCSGLVPKHKSLLDEEAKPEELEASQEKLSSRASCNLQLQGNSNATWDSAFRSELEPLQDKVLDYVSRSELEPSQDKVSESIIQRIWTEAVEEPEGSQKKLLQDKNNATLDFASMSELEPSQDKFSESIIQRFWTEAVEEPEGSQKKLLRDKNNATLDFASMSELEPLQDKVSESIIQRFWTSETELSQAERATMNCSLMASGALPMPVHSTPEAALSSASWIGNDITASCSSELGWFVSPDPPMPAHYALGALSSASWTGNDITASCSSELGRVVGAPTYNNLGGIAGGGFTSEPDMRSIPFPPVPPAAAASWFFSGPDIWSC